MDMFIGVLYVLAVLLALCIALLILSIQILEERRKNGENKEK